MKTLTTLLALLVLPLWADYALTVQNGGESLFQHPVSVELTAEQLAFAQSGAVLTEGAAEVPYALDTTGDAPQLCWTLVGETAPGAQRTFRLGSASGSVPAGGSAHAHVAGEEIVGRYFGLRHSPQGNGGFPQEVRFCESGYAETKLQFYDRLHHPGVGTFWAKNDRAATSQVVLDTPQRVVVESRTRFLNDAGEEAPGHPVAVYHYVYAPDSPVVEVRRTITREDASQKWNEAIFLQPSRFERAYDTILCGEPLQTTAVGPSDGEPRSFSFGQWGVFASPQGAFGVGGTAGGGYDRGRHGFPYNLAAKNFGWAAGEREHRQSALLYFGPAKTSEAWYARWLGSARPTVTIRECPPEPAEEIGDIILDCNGMKLYFGDAVEGFGCRGVENCLGDTPVRFVFPREPRLPLWRLSFQKPYAVRQKEAGQPGCPDTVWLSSMPAGSVPTQSCEGEKITFTWQGLDLPGEPGVVDVICTITPMAGRPEAEWRIRVVNRSQAWGLVETHYPLLGKVIRPGQGDALLPNNTWGHRLHRNSTVSTTQSYPGYKCPMQFMAFNQGDAGLYFAAHDPGARPKRLVVSSEQDASFQVFAENASRPGTGNGDDFAFCLAAYRGDWWQAAKRYRRWAISEPPWTAKGPIANRTDYPRSLVDATFWQRLDSGAQTDQLGTTMEELHARAGHRPGFALHWYCWHQIPFDNSYPEYFPAHEGFAANVRRLTAQGILVMPYINARLWDVDIPSFTTEVRNAAALPESGEPSLETYGSGRYLTPMCPYTKLWQDKIDEICTRLMDECKVSGIYLDQIGCAGPELCFNPTHGHPLGGGTHWVDGYRTMLARIKAKAAPRGVFLTHEASAEPYIDNIDGNLICTERFQEEVPTLAAVYSGYTIYFSVISHPRDELAAFCALQARDFLWGAQPGWNSKWMADEKHRAHFDYEVYLGDLQKAAKEFFREGELLGEQRPANDPGTATMTWLHKTPHQANLQAVQAYWWKARPTDGRLLLAIGNLSPEVRRFSVKDADLAALVGHNWKTYLAERLTADGTAPLFVAERHFSHDFTLESHEIVLVTFTPAERKTLKNAQKRAKTLVFDQKVSSELRNAASEYLFRTEYGLEFAPAAELSGTRGSTVAYVWELRGKAARKCTVVLPDGQALAARLGRWQAQLSPDAVAASPAWSELRRGDLGWRVPVERRLLEPLEVRLGEMPEIRAGKSFVLPVTVTCNQAGTTSCAVRLNLPESWEVEPSRLLAFADLACGQPQTVAVRVSVPQDAAAEAVYLTAEVIANRAGRAGAVQPPRLQLAVGHAASPIDPENPTNWPETSAWCGLGASVPATVKISECQGDDDCSARVRFAWDERFLYLQAEVTDNAHSQASIGEKLWSGDCLQLALRPTAPPPRRAYDGYEREIGLALTDAGFAYAYQWMGGPRNGLLDQVPLRIRRAGNRTSYCAAIPWSELLLEPPRPGEALLGSFTVNDNDGSGLRGWLEWTPGVCGGKDSSRFGELLFVK